MFKKVVESYRADANAYRGDYPDVLKFKAWSTKLINAFAKDVAAAGYTVEVKSKGHFHLSLFASKEGKIIYLSWDANSSVGYESVLFRTAKNVKDYTGGSNNFTKIDRITESLKDF